MSDWIKRIIIEVDDATTHEEMKDVAEHVLLNLGPCWAEVTTGPVYGADKVHVANVTVRKVPLNLQIARNQALMGDEELVQARERIAFLEAQVNMAAGVIALHAALPTPAADEVEAVRAGNAVLKGEGTGLYSEAEDAIRLLIAALQARSAEQPQDHWTVKALIKAGNALSMMAQTSGGTAGADPALIAAIEQWASVRRVVELEGGDPVIGAGVPAEPAGEEPVAWDDLGAERYVRDFIIHGEVSTRQLEPWEQAHQDAGHIDMAERRGYIHVGRDVPCTITVTDHGRRIAALLNRPATPTNPERLVDLKLACDAVIGDLGQVDSDGYYNGVVHESDVKHLEQCLAALSAAPLEEGQGE